MTNEQAKAVFNQALAGTTDKDQIANIELLREYFTNPGFRQHLEQMTYEHNSSKWSEFNANR